MDLNFEVSQFNSQEFDKETGYYYYNARYYNPVVSRFITPDTVIDGEYDTQGWNRYAYVRNNPILYKDPTGHSFFSDVWDGMKERTSSMVNTAKAIYKAPRKVAKQLVNKVKSTVKKYRQNPKQLLKDYGSAVIAPFKQMSGYNVVKGVSDVVTAKNPAKALGGKIVDVGVNVASNLVGAGVGKAAGALGKGVGRFLPRATKRGLVDKQAAKGASPGPINLMNKSDQFLVNASKRIDIDPKGMLDVVGHCNPSAFQVGNSIVDHRALANIIQKNPQFVGQEVRLLSCNTGSLPNGFAQNLANKMGVPVTAPSKTLWAYPSEKLTIGTTLAANNGQ